ncbi:MAG: hypothetical protein JO306_13205, partial [Gemmatimonadetes bacterium]|nr:hypothetical protein [Gemmatimonadota bacterium]
GILVQGLREAGLRGDQIEQVQTEETAVTRALSMLGDGELAVILADDVAGVLAQVRPRAAGAGM